MWGDERLREVAVTVDVSPLADSADGRYSSSSMDQKKGE
jgi:hypothetical protein